ncbi:hypothetical protein F5Y12DRAFT_718993 [Xylaria sp. FL1777]|nr:hypothetical protein F5Y12DRAFT_718993 [Xylaria sp. FL1777]
MGLLGFLSRKSYSDLARHDSLKTSAYDATVASSPPIRGTYPVLGNGSKILEEFQKSHPHLANVSRNNSQAPSPLLTRLRGPGVERPRTAPSSQLGDTTSTLHSQSQPALISPPLPKKRHGPYKLPPKVVTDIRDSSIPAKPTPSPGLVSIYSDSARSSGNGKTKGYVDLLDAQSMIKPSDFYGRVQATGARNYGEDVADRNRAEKNSDLDTTTIVQDKHAGGEWNSVISKDIDDDSDDEPRRPRIRHSISSGLRSQKTGSQTTDSFPKRTSSRLPYNPNETPKVMTRTQSARSERAARRKSMPSSLASASAEVPRSSSRGRKGKGKDHEFFPDSLRNHALAAMVHEREYSKPNISSKRQSLALLPVEHQSLHDLNDLDKPLPALPASSRNRSRRRTISHNNTVVESRLLAKRRSLQGINSTSRGEIYEDTYQQKKSLQAAQPSRDRNSVRRQLGSTTDLQDFFYSSPAQQPDHQSQIMYPLAKYTDDQGNLSQSNHLRKESIISLSSQSIMVAHKTGNPIPERTTSLGHWSLTSETALSTLSSNPFRPQSGHTTNTSIDLSPTFPRAHLNESIPPVPDISFLKSLESTSKDTPTILSPSRSLSTSHRHQSSQFFLGDYASSDDESSPNISRGSYEKDLLFSETSFSISGDQVAGLPGLFDMAVSASSATMLTIQTWGNELDSVPRQFHMPAYPETDSNDFVEGQDQAESSDEELNFDIPMSRASSALHYNPVQEKFPARTQPLQEEDDDSDF